MSPSRPTSSFPPQLGLLTGVAACSTASTLIRLAQGEMHSLAVAAWRLTLASLILAPFALVSRREELKNLTKREWVLALGSGVLLAIHFASWIASLALTSVAASVTLVATNPLFVGLISHLFLKERLSWLTIAGLIIAIVGSATIGLGDIEEGTHQLMGDVLALVGSLAGAGYFLIGRRLRARLSLLGYIFPVYSTAAIVLVIIAYLSRVEMAGYSSSAWTWLLLMALGPQIIGHSSLNWALRHLTASYVTLATLSEPIGSTLLAWLVLKESPSSTTLWGGGLILLGIVIASRTAGADETEPNQKTYLGKQENEF